jgi:ankyrin repeat protein
VASQFGHVEVVHLLLSKSDIDINKSLHDGQSPIFAAAESGHMNIVQLLLAAGSDTSQRVVNPSTLDPSCSGLIAMDIAQKNGHTEIVKLLLEHNN